MYIYIYCLKPRGLRGGYITHYGTQLAKNRNKSWKPVVVRSKCALQPLLQRVLPAKTSFTNWSMWQLGFARTSHLRCDVTLPPIICSWLFLSNWWNIFKLFPKRSTNRFLRQGLEPVSEAKTIGKTLTLLGSSCRNKTFSPSNFDHVILTRN